MAHKFLISGGGTGGHIFPAVAIAKELRRRHPECAILFVGAIGKMEMEKVPQEGFEIVGLEVEGLRRSLSLANIKVAWKIVKSYNKARKIIADFKPNCAIGTGGYASLATLYAATKRNIPTLIWEGNGYAGLSNKILSKKATIICTGLPNMEKFFPVERTVLTGNPVRQEILSLPDKKQALQFFALDERKPVVFITGGSLGARTINESIQNNLNQYGANGIQVIWQTGKNFEANTSGMHGIISKQFIREMNMAYAAADLVISRAGALSISEIAVAGKPAILVPSPNVTDDHQTKNALKLNEKGAAILVRDTDARETLVPESIKLLSDTNKMNAMCAALEQFARPNATMDIVNEILKISGQ